MKDLRDQVFTKLTPIGVFDKINSRARWLCKCECGNTKLVSVSNLLNGHTRSCGCLKQTNDQNKTHGMTRSKSYVVWANMNQRCFDPKATHFKHYGGRGITVSEDWKKFENFFADMGEPPIGLTIDRINNNGNYEKNNCRWATYKQQALNKRNNKCNR